MRPARVTHISPSTNKGFEALLQQAVVVNDPELTMSPVVVQTVDTRHVMLALTISSADGKVNVTALVGPSALELVIGAVHEQAGVLHMLTQELAMKPYVLNRPASWTELVPSREVYLSVTPPEVVR